MKKLTLCIVLLCCTGCSVTIVYTPKAVCNHGNNNTTELTGSDLRGNEANQSAQGEIDLPIVP
jgi:hypothetical protein